MQIEVYPIETEVPMPFSRAAHNILIEKVRAWFREVNLNSPDDKLWVCYALVYLHSRQTRIEQNSESTIRKNGVGFTTCDADVMSDYAKAFIGYGPGALKHGDMEVILAKIVKYAAQLADWDGSDYSGKCVPEDFQIYSNTSIHG